MKITRTEPVVQVVKPAMWQIEVNEDEFLSLRAALLLGINYTPDAKTCGEFRQLLSGILEARAR